jgi:Protein of unknown function (DUF1566)
MSTSFCVIGPRDVHFFVSAMVASIVLPLAYSTAVALPLNDTGQTHCYDTANMIVPCYTLAVVGDAGTLPRQDGRFGRDALSFNGPLAKVGAGAGGFDFTKLCMSGSVAGSESCPTNPPANTTSPTPGFNEWACTRDNVTGLVWSLQIIPNINWSDASSTAAGTPIAQANASNRCAKSSGWRLPTRRELVSLLHVGGAGSTVVNGVDQSFIPNGGNSVTTFWSSDVLASDATRAYTGFFNVIPTIASTPVIKTASAGMSLRLVWSSAAPAAQSFTANGDGTATDSLTGLVWDQCAVGQLGAVCSSGTPSLLFWHEALAAATTANASNYKGWNDWRVPNVKELESIIKLDRLSLPFIDPFVFPNSATADYWTSTTRVDDPRVAYQVNFTSTEITAPFFKTGRASRVRLVRGGDDASSYDALFTVFDVDGDGSCTTADALLMTRYLLGFRGNVLTAGINLATNLPRSNATAIASYLQGIAAALDVDGDFEAKGTTDGLMFLRYNKQLSGSALTNGAKSGPARTDVQIEDYLQRMCKPQTN